MKATVPAIFSAGAALLGLAQATVQGFDISDYQSSSYNFAGAYGAGARFVIIKVSSFYCGIDLPTDHDSVKS
jgi:hypothetical protein